jgi:hypothetical protein
MLKKKIFVLISTSAFFSCYINSGGEEMSQSSNSKEIILEGGIKLTIKDPSILPITIQYQNKKYKIYRNKDGKIVVKNLSLDQEKPPQGNF